MIVLLDALHFFPTDDGIIREDGYTKRMIPFVSLTDIGVYTKSTIISGYGIPVA